MPLGVDGSSAAGTSSSKEATATTKRPSNNSSPTPATSRKSNKEKAGTGDSGTPVPVAKTPPEGKKRPNAGATAGGGRGGGGGSPAPPLGAGKSAAHGGGGATGGTPATTPTSISSVPGTSDKTPPRRQSIDRQLHGRHPRLRKKAEEGSRATHPGGCCCHCCHETYMSYLDFFVGCPCFSIPVYSLDPEVAKHAKLFKSLGLKEGDVGVFYIYFRRIDLDGSGSITIAELLSYLGLEENKFTKRVFSIFDEDNSGSIDFREFVMSLWNYSTLPKASLILFAFDLYDKDASGMLELVEVERLLLEVYGSRYMENPHAKQIVVDLHERMGATPGMPVYMNVGDFGELCRRHPALLMPAFLYQESLRYKICGARFWRRCADIRFKLSDGEYVPIAILLEAAVSKQVAMGVAMAEQKGKATNSKTHDSQAMKFLKHIGGIKAVRQSQRDVLKGTTSKVAPSAIALAIPQANSGDNNNNNRMLPLGTISSSSGSFEDNRDQGNGHKNKP